MVTLTKEDLNILKAPFKAKEHEFLRGYTYITEFAIVTRIEDVDPAWEFVITTLDSRIAMGDKDQVQVTCTAALTISGVTRYGVGQAKAYETKPYVDKETGETKPTEEANEAEKSAATDALKRAARLFGIGRYLLMLPKNIKNEKQLGDWIKRGLDAKAKAEGLQDDIAYIQMEQMAKDYLLTGDERILTGKGVPDNRMPNLQGDDYYDELTEQSRGGFEDTRPYHGMPAVTVEDAILDTLLEGIEEKHDLHPHEWEDDSDLDVDQLLPKERYTTPTNMVVTKMGKGGNLYYVNEGCTFFSREAFRLLGYDDALIESLGDIGVTALPDTVTIVYEQKGDFKTPLRIRRNSTNEVVDVTNAPFLLRHADNI